MSETDPDEMRRLAHVVRDEVDGDYFARDIADALEVAAERIEELKEKAHREAHYARIAEQVIEGHGDVEAEYYEALERAEDEWRE